MLRDPLYREILKGLEEPLDPDLFEQCAADLLRKELPVVPIRGGRDMGMDAGVADAIGVAYPMVVTTAKDVIGNLTRNLKSYLKESGPRRRVILTTSRQLSATRRRNLEKRAEDLGFVLIQIYDQASVADRLYSSPEWCQELLNLTPDPPALSVLPRSMRPLLGSTLIGRHDEQNWLRNLKGDRLLAGQPGSGKTFLLHNLTRDEWGVFAVSDDIGKLAGALRAQRPQVVIVDDAHAHLRLLGDLRHLRDQTGAKFHIVATSWIGEHELVAEALNLPTTEVRTLEPLTRDEIVEVINGCGLRGPTPLVREIVDQAEGRPGLAATLAHLCLTGGIRDVVLGDALQRSYRSYLQRFIGRHAIEILACFAIGGSAGMEMAKVSDFLNVSIASVRETLVQLAAAGLVTEVDGPSDAGAFLAVEPSALRQVLVRDVFFAGSVRLPYQDIATAVPDKGEAALVLIGARARGALVPNDLLYQSVEDADTAQVWESYAYLGPDESRTALERRPNLAVQLAHPGLRTSPETLIPRLLAAGSGDDRPLHSTPEHPLRLIQDWLKQVTPGTGDAVHRRRILIRQARAFLSSGGDNRVAARALCLALQPGFEHHESDPGMGMKLTLRWGLLPPSELGAIAELWDEIREALSDHTDFLEWGVILNAIGDWVYPGRHVGSLTVEENLRIGATIRKPGPEVEADIEVQLDRFPALRRYFRGRAGRLSGGEQQQLAIARALLSRPRLLLMDEPSLGLAPALVDMVLRIVVELREQEVTVLLVEQNANRAVELADHSYVFVKGEVVATGTRDDFRSRDDLASLYLGIEQPR